MLARWLTEFDFLAWRALLVPTVAVAMAGLTLLAVRRGRERQRASLALEEQPEAGCTSAGPSAANTRGQHKNPPQAERRSSLRRPGNPVAVLVANATGSTKTWDGWVLDRSRGGLRLAVRKPMAVGTLLQVRTTHDPECAPWVQLRVKQCRQRDKVWVLGCQFVQMPPLNVLLLFG
jgi:hypothetical protein